MTRRKSFAQLACLAFALALGVVAWLTRESPVQRRLAQADGGIVPVSAARSAPPFQPDRQAVAVVGTAYEIRSKANLSIVCEGDQVAVRAVVLARRARGDRRAYDLGELAAIAPMVLSQGAATCDVQLSDQIEFDSEVYIGLAPLRPGYCPTMVRLGTVAELVAAGDHVQEHSVVLAKGRNYNVVTQTLDGSPKPGITLIPTLAENWLNTDGRYLVAGTSDEHGRLQFLSALPDSIEVRSLTRGWVVVEEDAWIRVPSSESMVKVTASPFVAGKVRTITGAPAPGVRVEVLQQVLVGAGNTNSAGEFWIAVKSTTEAPLTIAIVDRDSSSREVVAVGVALNSATLDVRSASLKEVRLRAVATSGECVERYGIRTCNAGTRVGAGRIVHVGRHRNGELKFVAWTKGGTAIQVVPAVPDYGPTDFLVTSDAPQDSLDVSICVPRVVPWRIMVVGDQGTPVAGCRVDLIGIGDAGKAWYKDAIDLLTDGIPQVAQRSTIISSDLTSADGGVMLRARSVPGRMGLRVTVGGQLLAFQEVRSEGRDVYVVIPLRNCGTVSGSILGLEAVPEQVWFVELASEVGTSRLRVQPDGGFAASAILAGTYRVWLCDAAEVRKLLVGELSVTGGLECSKVFSVDLRDYEVALEFADWPVSSKVAIASCERQDDMDVKIDEVTIAVPAGSNVARFRLQAGRYRVAILEDTGTGVVHHYAPEPIVVDADQRIAVSVGRVALRVKLSGTAGTGVAKWTRVGQSNWTLTTVVDGATSLRDVPPGRYRLELADGRSTDVDVRLGPRTIEVGL